jgi:hypothetical protein
MGEAKKVKQKIHSATTLDELVLYWVGNAKVDGVEVSERATSTSIISYGTWYFVVATDGTAASGPACISQFTRH